MSDNKHFVCSGECGGVSDTTGVCKAGDDNCSCAGEELVECDCDSEEHKKALKENK